MCRLYFQESTQMAGMTEYNLCECPICNDDFKDPKMLPCGHVMCQNCVRAWLKAQGLQNGCPLCRTAITPTPSNEHSWTGDANTMINTLVDSLPKDIAAEAVVDSKTLLAGNSGCNVCDKTPTTSFCFVCHMKLCSACTNGHARVPATREHRLEPLNTLTPERLAACRGSPCDEHPDLPAKHYCPAHQTLICLSCSSSTHRSCPGVTDMEKMAKTKRAELGKQVSRLREKKADLLAKIEQIKDRMAKIKTQSNAKQAKVDAMYSHLKQVVDQRCCNLKGSIQAEEAEVTAVMASISSALKSQHGSIAAHLYTTDRLLVTAADGPLLTSLNKLRTSLDAMKELPDPKLPVDANEIPFAEFDAETLKVLESIIADFGTLIRTSDLASSAMKPNSSTEKLLTELNIDFISRIGNGKISDVYKATFGPMNMLVAVKCYRDTLIDADRREFMMKARLWTQFDHPNVIKIIGVAAFHQPFSVIFEYASGGCLRDFLHSSGKQLSEKCLIQMCIDVASGMAYIAQKGFIHRQVASFNCLVCDQNVIKISSFRSLLKGKEYTFLSSDQFPVRWMAPEAMLDNKCVFTTFSDVWSFGVLMWEIFSAGYHPYPEIPISEVKVKIFHGYRLSKPPRMPDDVNRIMQKCWRHTPNKRPQFMEICDALNECSRK